MSCMTGQFDSIKNKCSAREGDSDDVREDTAEAKLCFPRLLFAFSNGMVKFHAVLGKDQCKCDQLYEFVHFRVPFQIGVGGLKPTLK